MCKKEDQHIGSKIIAVLGNARNMKNYKLLIYGGLVFAGLLLVMILISDNPLEWIGVIGGAMGGLGSIGTVIFAWWAIMQNNRIHQNYLLQVEIEEYRRDTRELINNLENSISKIVYRNYYEPEKQGATLVAEEAIHKYLDEFLSDPYMAISSDLYELSPLEASDRCKNNKELSLVFRQCDLLFLKIVNSNDRKYLLNYFSHKLIPYNMLLIYFIRTLFIEYDTRLKILFQRNEPTLRLTCDYIIDKKQSIYFIVRSTLNRINAITEMSVDRNDLGECTVRKLSGMFKTLSYLVLFDSKYFYELSIFVININVDKINNLAEKIGSPIRITCESNIIKFIID